MQTLRKKNSPRKFKYEPTRFLGDGISFKAKLIGILEVSEASGNGMCQAALADLKMAIRAAGEHKQRIAVQVSIDGIRLKDEKTGEGLYHHPVHKISFISQDKSDTRAFGYIFGSPDTGHRFFGIKTEKAAVQLVIAMRDLFQVVFDLKKKEIEIAKQHIEQNTINAIKFHTGGMFVEPAPDTKGAAGSESTLHRIRAANSETEKPAAKNESQGGVIADLLDLQFELNSLQQGIHQMDKITPENPVPTADDLFETDPFGDSFANMKLKETVRPILPPPPSSSKRGHLERQQTVPAQAASNTSSPATNLSSKTPPPQSSIHWFDKETENLFSEGELASLTKASAIKKEDDISLNTTPQPAVAKSPQIDVFTELDPLGTGLIKPYVDKKDFFQHLKNPPKKVLKDLVPTSSSDTFPTNFVMSEPLEPTTTTNGSLSLDSNAFDDTNFANFDRFDENEALQSATARADSPKKEPVQRITHHQSLSVNLPPEEPAITPKSVSGTAPIARMDKDSTESIQSLVKLPSPKKYLQSVRKREFDMDLSRGQSTDKPFPVDFAATSDSPASPLRSCSSDANSRLSSSSAELDLVPEPPPRGAGSILLNPPPLPPKKQGARGIKPPPRPPYTEAHFHYDFPERETASPSPTRSRDRKSPSRDTRSQFDDNFSPPPRIQTTDRSDIIGTMTTSAFEDSFSNMIPTTNLSTFFTCMTTQAETRKTKPSLDITLSQLTSSNLDDLAATLGMRVQELTSLTLQQLTESLAGLSEKESAASETRDVPKKAEPAVSMQTHVQPPAQPVQPIPQVQSIPPVQQIQSVQSVQPIEQHPPTMESSKPSTEPLFKTTFDQEPKQEPAYDKYAVLRELYEMEQMKEKSKAVEEEEEDEYEEEEQNEQEEEEFKDEEEEVTGDRRDSEDVEQQLDVFHDAGSGSIVSLVNLTVKLPPLENTMKEHQETMKDDVESKDVQPAEDSMEEEKASEQEEIKEVPASPRLEEIFEDARPTLDIEERLEAPEKDLGANFEKNVVIDSAAEETNGSSIVDKVEVKSSTSTSSDKYAALREFIGEPEPAMAKPEETIVSPRQPSPVQLVTKSLAEVELTSLFSDVPPSGSPKKMPRKDEDLKSVAMDIFEEIQMLNTGTSRSRSDTKSVPSSGFEDVFCPFGEDRSKNVDDEEENWAKFDTDVFRSDRSSCEGPRSVGGTSPWSPDGKEFHREASFKGSSAHRHSGDSDNEWKDEEESEESNGRMRDRFYCGRHARFDAPAFDDRSFYEDTIPSDKRERGFRERVGRKSRAAPWSKNAAHRPRDPLPWHEEGQWEDEPRRYPHRKMPYKDDKEQYEPHWKCRPKPQRWNWSHGHNVPASSSFYDDERKRKLMLWNEEDRFGSEESMGYEEDDRWSCRKYERRRWEDDCRFWGRRPPPEADYPMRDYYYYRDSRAHDYSATWDEDYRPERPGEDSPRYNTARKRHWPKRPNSANEGRNSDVAYGDPRKFRASRSECSDNDSVPYLRPSQRSRSRESYWGSDQEFDSWVERLYWSEGPESKSETMHRKRIARHKPRQSQAKAQSPLDDECAQDVEQIDSPVVESSASAPDSARSRSDAEQKREKSIEGPLSPSPRDTKDRRDPQRDYFKRSSYFEDDLTPSASSDASDLARQRLPDLKATPEDLPPDAKQDSHRSTDGFASEDSGGRDSFFNGDLRFENDAFDFKAELEDSVPEHHRATTLPVKSSRQNKYAPAAGNNNNNSKTRADQYIRKSESVNIFVRENDPFDDDDFFN